MRVYGNCAGTHRSTIALQTHNLHSYHLTLSSPPWIQPQLPNPELALAPSTYSMMACATTTTTPIFSFHTKTISNNTPPFPKPKPHFPLKLISLSTITQKPQFIPKSIDVSKEDNPISQSPVPPVDAQSEFQVDEPTEVVFDKRRLEEKFAVLNTGIYECRSCGYKYDESTGDPLYPIPPGLPFDKLPEDWRCATCGAAKTFFVSKSVEIAGFAQNQQFGLGANALTSGQKAALIYGSLLLFFALFLSGYFLQ